ncbi:MAG: SusC/RagA family TonB-linked outer membrane protein [Gemmatimonadaceae bacterium]
MQFIRMTRRGVAVLATALSVTAGGTAAAQGTITGRVLAQGSSEPIPEARVIVLGTSLFTTSSAEGRYTIRNVPAGTAEVRVLRVGFAEQKKSAAVANGQTTTLDYTLTPVAIKLQEVVTTATGSERTVTQGSKIEQINAAELTATKPITSIGDLLTARAPGVQVMPNNMTGASARVRIRGASSLSLSNDPIYIIDGMRMTSDNGSQSIGIGGTTFSRVGDINPQDIENIEIVKGPSAATLYGTDAANGVIVITTKRGRAGKARWNTFVENGIVTDHNTYPTAYTLWGHAPATPSVSAQCFVSQLAAGTCVKDSLQSFNLWADPETTPLGTGQRQQYGLSTSGGADALTYFVSGDYEKELGVYTIPQFDRTRLENSLVDIRQEWLRPNALEKQNFRVNLTSAISPTFDLQTSGGFIHLNQRLPQTDNNTTGLASSAYGGPGTRDNGLGSLGFPKNGYRAFTPGDIFQETYNQQINRFIGSMNANWRPFAWMANRANMGIDYSNRTETDLCRRGNCSDFSTNRLGFSTDNRANIRNFSVDLASASSFQPMVTLNSKTTLGAQYINYDFDRNGANGTNLTPGTVSPVGGAVQNVTAATTFTKTLGLFVEEALAWRDRLFLTGAMRTDQNTAFGTNFQSVFYPKLSASYVISEEDYFPKISSLNQLRLRATYGAAGTQPGPNDALRFFRPVNVNVDKTDVGGAVLGSSDNIGGIGNADLRPERATEFEGGFDAKMFNSRINLELTYYSKSTKDALIQRILPPSAGVASARFENLGRVKNAGLEALINAQLAESNRFGWDMTFAASTNANKLVDLGTDPTGKPIPNIVGTLIQQRAGYPLNGWWSRPITGYNDANGDGILSVSEVTVGDTAVYLGYSNPRHEASLTNGFDLFNRQLRITALFDYKGGYLGDNDTQRIRCQNRLNCFEESDPTAPLELQARSVALRDNPARTQAGFIEDGKFIRWRELSVTYAAPSNLATRLFRSESASLTFAARNLHVWTNYTGVDPESSYGSLDVPNDFQTAPPPTYFTLRLNLGF